MAFNRNPFAGLRLFEEVIGSPNLVSLWLMNETSGTLYDRSIVNRYDATVSGNPDYSKLITSAYGLDFEGSDYASIGDVAGLDFAKSDTFSIMVIVDPNISALGEILSKWSGVVSDAGWALGFNSTRTWRLLLQNSETNALEVRSNAALTNGVDKMLLVTYAGTSAAAGIVMYENGVAVAMATTTNALSLSIDNAVAAVIGGHSDGSGSMDGDLAFLTVWNKVVSAEDARRYAIIGGFL